MSKIALLAIGVSLIFIQKYFQPISIQLQFIIFVTGILFLGIPHGAADLLVATQNNLNENKPLSKLKFFINYLGRLILFSLSLWFFPLPATLLFIIFSAYHFGETDLYQFKITNITGLLFVISYGMIIIDVIILSHFEEAKLLFKIFNLNSKQTELINLIEQYRYVILFFSALFFFICTFINFFVNGRDQKKNGEFLVQLALISSILFFLPMILGFTFYFIVWHSVLSLSNIVSYLRKDDLYAATFIAKQISIYSVLAIVGIILFGLSGFMLMDHNSMTLSIFIGLAVLTAPHMQIMHEMYNNTRTYHTTTKKI